MSSEDFDIGQLLRKNSSNHHYIPQFLIKGFLNAEERLYVFDKRENKILNKAKVAKGIFYERDRNTVEIKGKQQSSFIEDALYSRIDNQVSQVVKFFQEGNLNEIEFNAENTGQFLFFLITLFWRIPYTDWAASDIINKSEIISDDIDPEMLRNDPTFRKMQRVALFKHTIDEMRTHGKKGKVIVNIRELASDWHVIGDNPILFQSIPKQFKDLADDNCVIAITSKRLYSRTENPLRLWDKYCALKHNALIIDQSVRYIGCSNLDVLKASVDFYFDLKSNGLLPDVLNQIFTAAPN